MTIVERQATAALTPIELDPGDVLRFSLVAGTPIFAPLDLDGHGLSETVYDGHRNNC